MPRKKTEMKVTSDSEHDSGSESENDHAESDSEGDSDDFGKLLANSTKVIETKRSNVKLELAKILREQASSKLRHTAAIKKIQWDKINIQGYEPEELKGILQEIVKATGVTRTLDEILTDYESNFMKLDIASHPDLPTRPINAVLNYIVQNREKLTKHLEKEKTDGSAVNWKEIFKYGNEKFKTLSDKKKDVYVKQYKAELDAYRKSKQEFFTTHPEMKIQKKTTTAKLTKKQSETVKKPLLITPFSQFRKHLLAEGKPVLLRVAQKMWKDLPDEEKGEYVAEVMEMDNEDPKKISKEERKIFSRKCGMPDQPLSAHNIFVKQLKATYTGDSKEFLKFAAKEWKTISEKEKKVFQLQAEKNTEKWRSEMEAYIRKLPGEQQPMMFSKYNVLKTPTKSRKSNQENGNVKKVGSNSKSQIDTEDSDADETPKTKKRMLDSEDSDDYETPKAKKTKIDSDDDVKPKAKKRMLDSEDTDDDETPNKMKNGNIESKTEKLLLSKKLKQESKDEKQASPKKKRPKEPEPEYPSQTTAHYFMTKIYEGKPHKVAKAYNQLERKQKLKYRDETRKLCREFLKQTSAYMLSLDYNEKKAHANKLQDLSKQQKRETSWHVSTGTDNEKNDVEESSDSDDS